MSEVTLAAPVKATFLQDVDADEREDVPGGFTFYVKAESGDQPRGMIYTCPCGCKRRGALPFRPTTGDDVGRASWEWDGNREVPTLNPSVHHVGHWHGWLKAGFWTQA